MIVSSHYSSLLHYIPVDSSLYSIYSILNFSQTLITLQTKMSNNFFGGHNFNRHAFLAAYMDVHHRPRPLSSPPTELRAVADAVAVANARRPLVHEGADRAVSLVLAQGHDINVDADRLVGEGVDADTDPYADELELARDSEVEEDDEDEWKIEKMEVIRKLREENEERFADFGRIVQK